MPACKICVATFSKAAHTCICLRSLASRRSAARELIVPCDCVVVFLLPPVAAAAAAEEDIVGYKDSLCCLTEGDGNSAG